MNISAHVAAGLKLLGSPGIITEDCFTKLLEAGVTVITDSQKLPSKYYCLTAECSENLQHPYDFRMEDCSSTCLINFPVALPDYMIPHTT
jgi:hypothetical protein